MTLSSTPQSTKKRFNTGVAIPAADSERLPFMGWVPAALLSGAMAALVGIVIVCGICVFAWVDMPGMGFSSVFPLAIRLWLLGHGAGVSADAVTITVPPLGLTLIFLALAATCARFAGKQARMRAPERISAKIRLYLTAKSTMIFVIGYLAIFLPSVIVVGSMTKVSRSLIAALVLAAIAGFIGIGRACSLDLTLWLPGWAKAIPRAVYATQLVMMIAGAAVLLVAFVLHRSDIAAIHTSLKPQATGHWSLIFIQLAWLPNFVLWAAAWSIGAGFSLGVDTVVSPAAVHLGFVPAIPAFAALPNPGNPSPWLIAWMVFGFIAGIVGALLIVIARPRARFDETAVVGCVSGIISGVVFTAISVVGNGALGTDRLGVIGTRGLETLVMSTVVMGIAGLVTGLIVGMIRKPGKSGAEVTVVYTPQDLTNPVRDEDARAGNLDAEATVAMISLARPVQPTEIDDSSDPDSSQHTPSSSDGTSTAGSGQVSESDKDLEWGARSHDGETHKRVEPDFDLGHSEGKTNGAEARFEGPLIRAGDEPEDGIDQTKDRR